MALCPKRLKPEILRGPDKGPERWVYDLAHVQGTCTGMVPARIGVFVLVWFVVVVIVVFTEGFGVWISKCSEGSLTWEVGLG